MTHRFSFGFLAALMLFCIVLAGCGQEQAAPVKERVVTDPVGIRCLCGGRLGRPHRGDASVGEGGLRDIHAEKTRAGDGEHFERFRGE